MLCYLSMLNKLQIYFLGFIFFIVLLVVCFAIFVPSQSSIHLEEIKFSTSQSSRLYFKNLRSYYYEKDEVEKPGFILHQYKSDGEENLRFLIVDNWKHDEAYIIAESAIVNIDEEILQIMWTRGNESDTISLKELDAEAHYVFAAQLYDKLLQEGELAIIKKTDSFLFTGNEKKSLKITLKDFFKLVEKVR